MSIKKFTLFIVVLMLGLFLAGCDFFGGEDVVVIDNTPTEVLIIYAGGESLNVAQTKQLTATVAPAGAVQTVTWAVDDEEIATISATGLLTAVGEGTVNITATSTELTTISATVEFTVIETDVQKMDKINAVETGLKAILPAVITGDYILPAYDADPDVLVRYIYNGSFHATGTVFEYNPGPTDLRQTISVNLTYGGKAKTFDIAFTIAKDVNLAGITGSSYVLIGETTPLLASLTGTGITWSSSNEAVATVNSTGVVTGVTVGDAVITISDGTVSYTFDIAVIAPGNADLLLAYQAKNFIISNIPASTREDFDLPPYTGAVIEYEIDELPVTSFIATQGINNTVVTISTTVTVNATVITFDIEVVVLAKTDDVIVAEALAALDAYLEDKGYTDAEFRATGNMDFAGFVFEGVVITWTSEVTSVISNEGVYTRGNDDSYVPLQVRLNKNSQNQNRKFTILAGGYSQAEKIEFMTTDEEGVLTDLMNGSTKSGVNLPSLDQRFGATITWTSSNTAVLNNDGSLVAPVSAPVAMTLNATITYYKGANNINNFVQTVEVPFTVNPFENDVELAAYNYGLEAECVPAHFPYGKDEVIQLTGLDATFTSGDYTYDLAWAPADTQIFNASFTLQKQYFMYKETAVVATLTRTGSTDIATTEFIINVGIAENPTDVAVALTSAVSNAGFVYDTWYATNGFSGAADGGVNASDRAWQGFSGNIFKTTITVQEPALDGQGQPILDAEENPVMEDVNYVVYVVSANTNYVNLGVGNTRDGVVANGEDATKKYLGSTGLSGSFGRVAKNTTEASIWVKDSVAANFPGFNYLTAYKAIILNFDPVTKLCTPIEVPMDASGTEYEIKAGGFLIQRGFIDQGVYDMLRNETLTVEHLFFTKK